MPSPAASVATQTWAWVRNCFLGAFAFVGIHAAMNLAGGVAPAGQVFLDVVERVAVLGKQQQFATAIFEFGERGAGTGIL